MNHDLNTWLEHLRHLLASPPDEPNRWGKPQDSERWTNLLDWIEQLPQATPTSLWLPYAEAHLATWPDEERSIPRRTLDALIEGEAAPPWLPLCRALVVPFDWGEEENCSVLSAAELRCLLPRLPDTLTSIEINFVEIEQIGLPELLARSPQLASLDLTCTGLQARQLQQLLESLCSPGALRQLRLTGTRVGSAGAHLLAAAPLHALEELSLYNSEVDEAGTRALGASPHLGALKRLTLDSRAFGVIGEDLGLFNSLPNILRILDKNLSVWDVFLGNFNHQTPWWMIEDEDEDVEPSPPPRPRASRDGEVPRRPAPRRGSLAAQLGEARRGWSGARLLEQLQAQPPAVMAEALQHGEVALEALVEALAVDLVERAGLEALAGDAARALRDVLREPELLVQSARRWIGAPPEVGRWIALRRAQRALAARVLELAAPEDPRALRGALRGASLEVQTLAARLVLRHHPELPHDLLRRRLGVSSLEFAPAEVGKQAQRWLEAVWPPAT